VIIEVRTRDTADPSGDSSERPGWIATANSRSPSRPAASTRSGLSVVRFRDNPEHKTGPQRKLVIRDEPPNPGNGCCRQDQRTLTDTAFYGFGVDAGMGCFYDARRRGFCRLDRGKVLGDAITAPMSDPASGTTRRLPHGWATGHTDLDRTRPGGMSSARRRHAPQPDQRAPSRLMPSTKLNIEELDCSGLIGAFARREIWRMGFSTAPSLSLASVARTLLGLSLDWPLR